VKWSLKQEINGLEARMKDMENEFGLTMNTLDS
jgi:hypothetical protein